MKAILLSSVPTGLAALAALGLLLGGCHKSGTSPIDFAPLQSAFATAEASVKGPVDEAVQALQAGNLFEGTTTLVTVTQTPESLGDAQKAALRSLAQQLRIVLAKDGDRADLKVHEAINQLLAGLGEGPASPAGAPSDGVRRSRAPGSKSE